MTPPPALLVIAGHDPSSGPAGFAGLRADFEAAAAAARRITGDSTGLEVRTVVTAWTDQDDGGVRSLGARDPDEWFEDASREVEAANSRGGLRGLKTGLLPSAAHVHTLALLIRSLRAENPDLPIVVDPILHSSSGAEFLDPLGQSTLLSQVLPQGVILTPNLDEATALSGGPQPPQPQLDSRLRQAQTLLARGARGVVIKGGHGSEDSILNLVARAEGQITWQEHPRRPGSRRGTGCRFASALAAGLGLDLSLEAAADLAAEAVAACFDEGSGT